MNDKSDKQSAERAREESAAARHRAAEHAKTLAQQQFAAEQEEASRKLDALHAKLHPEKY